MKVSPCGGRLPGPRGCRGRCRDRSARGPRRRPRGRARRGRRARALRRSASECRCRSIVGPGLGCGGGGACGRAGEPLRYFKGAPPAAEERWSGQRDSNPRHQAWEACTLPTELCPHGRSVVAAIIPPSRRSQYPGAIRPIADRRRAPACIFPLARLYSRAVRQQRSRHADLRIPVRRLRYAAGTHPQARRGRPADLRGLPEADAAGDLQDRLHPQGLRVVRHRLPERGPEEGARRGRSRAARPPRKKASAAKKKPAAAEKRPRRRRRSPPPPAAAAKRRRERASTKKKR